jgi:hypothetical protein
VTKTRVDITWFGRETWLTAPPLCSPAARRPPPAGAHLSCRFSAGRWRFLTELLGQREPVLAGNPTGRGRLPHIAGLAPLPAERAPGFRPLPHGPESRELLASAWAGDPTGTLGGSQRLFSIHFGLQYCGPDRRGLFLPATKDEAAAEFLSNTPTFWNRMSTRGRSQRKGLWSPA